MFSDMRDMGPWGAVSAGWCPARVLPKLRCWVVTEQGMGHSGCQLWAPVQKATASLSAKEAAASQMLLSVWAWGPE